MSGTLTLGRGSRLGGISGRKPRRNVRKVGRRRTLDGAGAGERVLTLARRFLLTVLGAAVLVGLCIALVAGYRLVTTHPYFAIEEISVAGTERLSYGEVLESAGVGLGMNSLELKLDDAVARLSANPWVSSAVVRRRIPDRLEITVHEKLPYFWRMQGERMVYADATGRAIAPVDPAHFASLPVLDVAGEAHSDVGVLPVLADMLGRGRLPFGLAQAAWVRLTPGRRMELKLDGRDLTLAVDMDRFDEHLGRVLQVWRDLERRGELDGVSAIRARAGKVWVKTKAPLPS